MRMFGWRVSARKARSRERVLSEFAGERRLQSGASTKCLVSTDLSQAEGLLNLSQRATEEID